MHKFGIKSILKTFKNARKANFEVKCLKGNQEYEFKISRNSNTTLTITDLDKGVSMTTTYDEIDNIFLPNDDYKVTLVKEIILTPHNTVYSEKIEYCVDQVQVYLPVFRVLGEQVVFLLKTKEGLKQMYFINGKVFYVIVSDDSFTLYQTDLRRLFNTFAESEIIMFDKLPQKYTYNMFIKENHQKSKDMGFLWYHVKNGVIVGGN